MNNVHHTTVRTLFCDFAYIYIYGKGLIQVRATCFILVYLYAVQL